MRFGVALRNILRPLSLSSSTPVTSQISTTLPFHASYCKPPQFLLPFLNHFHSLTDTRFPKRRPSDKPRRKRASLRPSGACVVSLFFTFHALILFIYFVSHYSSFDIFQGLMLGLNIQLAKPYFPISLMRGVSRGGMRRNA